MYSHAAQFKDAAQVTAVNIALDTDEPPAVVWHHDTLPTDSHLLVALPAPLGGAVVVGVNVVLYLAQVCVVVQPSAACPSTLPVRLCALM